MSESSVCPKCGSEHIEAEIVEIFRQTDAKDIWQCGTMQILCTGDIVQSGKCMKLQLAAVTAELADARAVVEAVELVQREPMPLEHIFDAASAYRERWGKE